jgi:hypothetical protein
MGSALSITTNTSTGLRCEAFSETRRIWWEQTEGEPLQRFALKTLFLQM